MKAKLFYDSGEQNMEFTTAMPSHETGLIVLAAQISKWAWAHGIHRFDKIIIEAEESDMSSALAEGRKLP